MMTKSEIVHRIEAYIPNVVLKVYRKSKRFLIWKRQQFAYQKAIKRARAKKEPLNVVFIVHDSAIWKYDSLYRLMQKDGDFNPIILVCPIIIYQTEEQAKDILQRTYETFSSRGYHVIKASEQIYAHGISIKSLKPDIIFYSYLWTGSIEAQYNVQHLRKYLKCYVDYGYCSIADEWGYASAFHGLMWRYFAECEDIKQLALAAQPREMQNAVVTGYPIYDEYELARGDASVWKNANPKFRRVIWAPHHTIEGNDGVLKFSTFLENAEAMLTFVEDFKDVIQFAFKPHPQLKAVLYRHPSWGKIKTDAYYEKWANGENTTLVNGPYLELFKSSDAMIHDCGSFIVEYLYSKKPVMYLGRNRESQSNIVGKRAYECHYHGENIQDIKYFLDDIVLGGKDDMKPLREQFYNDVLLPPNGCSVAENIIDEIKKCLKKDYYI